MTDEEKCHYSTLKTQHPNAVLLLKTSTGHWAVRGADMDYVLSVYPVATLGADFVAFDDKRLDAIITRLNAKGTKVALAEQVKKAQKGTQIERLRQSSFID